MFYNQTAYQKATSVRGTVKGACIWWINKEVNNKEDSHNDIKWKSGEEVTH